AQEHPHPSSSPAAAMPLQPPAAAVPLQPLAAQVRRLEAALGFLGEPFTADERRDLNDAVAIADEADAVARLQAVLDRRVLVMAHVNPESRVRVEPGTAVPDLVQGGTRLFLVKVFNEAGITAPLAVRSPNGGRVFVPAKGGVGAPEPAMVLGDPEVRERWAEISLYTDNPMRARLSGLAIEYAILQIYSRDAGQRSATLSFDVGQGTQDLGFRGDLDVLFTAAPAHPIRLRVVDENNRPATAAFLITDKIGRVYPALSKRLAPDFYFQPQVYRADAETIRLPAGAYDLTVSRGPEYLAESRQAAVTGPGEWLFRLVRWINPVRYGWYPGDHHIHSAGCSHYENPTQGVLPKDMWPQIAGEALSVASVLIWGPSYYFQKQFFSGQDHPLSTPDTLMHYDVEVSGFPSSHAGHLVLLGLTDQDYPGSRRLEDWPTWTLPVLRWARAQNAVVGFAHSGWGLEVRSQALPNYEMPAFDGIGANEFIVDVTQPGAVDFISAGDTPYVWELNIWYHILNAGFRTRISGETDFPCITDDRVGQARSYAKVDGALTYRKWIDAIRSGRAYVSDGKSHLMDFTVNGVAAGTGDSEIRLAAPGRAAVTVTAAARLEETPVEAVRRARYDEKPYWDLERARIGHSRDVPVEVVVNGVVVATRTIPADGVVRTLTFDVALDRSSWIAARILPSSHTNPVFALVGGKPVRASRQSLQWCLDAVSQCWTQKAGRIRASELEAARAAYDSARQTYRQRLAETP
ncbi:MAG: CehA/McbA family metallohydrolase, partial [Acidobacteriota bacterium]